MKVKISWHTEGKVEQNSKYSIHAMRISGIA
jgi:hypothetical protein